MTQRNDHMNLPETSTAAFEADVLTSDKPVLVDFTADWCGPCRMVTPVLKQIAEERPDLRVLQVDADANPELTLRYRVMGLPSMALFRGGELLTVLVGAQPKSRLLSSLEAALAR
ncbi:MAG: trxA [Frankiales bacterium]|nr:trxA [Frankiales bacterium]